MLEVDVRFTRGDFSLVGEIRDEGFLCLSGLNGSGKSTLLNIIAGTLKSDSGHVKVGETDVTGLPQEERDIVLVRPDSLIPHLQVDKHLRWGMQVRKHEPDEERVRRVKEALGVNYHGRVDSLSLGMRERVSLATAVLARPKVLLVDEAFSNIDNKEETILRFKALCAESSIDIVTTTQQKSEARVADHHYDIVAGKTSRIF